MVFPLTPFDTTVPIKIPTNNVAITVNVDASLRVLSFSMNVLIFIPVPI
ncbi:MAG: hypothetical protein NVS9B15_09780 [Acidobacteriaceae bacterium]